MSRAEHTFTDAACPKCEGRPCDLMVGRKRELVGEAFNPIVHTRTYGKTIQCRHCKKVVLEDSVHNGYPGPHKCALVAQPATLTLVLGEITAELHRADTLHPNYPPADNPVRRVGIIMEECGEAMARALDLTRHPSSPRPQKWLPTPEGVHTRRAMTDAELLDDMYREVVEIGATAVRMLVAMQQEREVKS